MTKARMRSSTKRLSWLLFVVVLLALLQSTFGWSIFVDFFESNVVTAWVQGLGTIAAVFVAIRHASEQRKREQEAETAEANETRRVMTFTILHTIEAAEKTLRYLYLDLSVHVGQDRPKRTERIEDLLQTFETLLAKNVPDDLLPHVLAVKRELAYGLMALRSLQDTKRVTPRRVRGARTRYHRVRDTCAAIRVKLETLGYVFEQPAFARSKVRTLDAAPDIGSDVTVQFSLPPTDEFALDIPLEVEMTEED